MTVPYAPLPAPGPAPPSGDGWAAGGGPRRAPARPLSQVAVWVVCALAVVLAAASAGVPGWGVALAGSLAAGIAIGLAIDAQRGFRRLSGLVAAMGTVVGGVFLFAVGGGGSASSFGFVLCAGAFVLGLDWTFVDRLRSLPPVAGVVVVFALLSGEPWTFAVGVLWLAAAFGSLSLLEADRRAGQPRAQPTAGAGPPAVRTGDILTTVLLALGLALVAAMVLSVPSCQRRMGGGSSGVSSPGSGFGSGSGSGYGSGSGSVGGPGQGSAADHRYVPDPSGRYLVPDPDGIGSAGSRSPIPAPDRLAQVGPGEERSTTGSDGRRVIVRGLADGGREAVVVDPDGTTHRYRYHDGADGLTRIDELDASGRITGTYWYDPEGKLATGGPANGSPPSPPPDQPRHHRSWRRPSTRAVLLGLLVAAAVAAIAWYLVRRLRRPRSETAGPAAPPWALALVARLEEEGRARSRPRRAAEPVVAYARALVEGPWPDPRLAEVAAIASHGLFARTDPGPAARQRAEDALAQAIADHPMPQPEKRRLVASR